MSYIDIEKEAKEAGLKTTKKRGGNKTVAKSTKTTCPEQKKRGRAAAQVSNESPTRKSERANLGTKKKRYESLSCRLGI